MCVKWKYNMNSGIKLVFFLF